MTSWLYVAADGTPSRYRYAAPLTAAAAAIWIGAGVETDFTGMTVDEVLALATAHGFTIRQED